MYMYMYIHVCTVHVQCMYVYSLTWIFNTMEMHVSCFMFYAGADSSEKGEVLGVCGKNNDNSVNLVITIVYIHVYMYMYIHDILYM